MAKKEFIRTKSSTSRIVEADIRISGSLMLPAVEANEDALPNAIAVQDGGLMMYDGTAWNEISGGIDVDGINNTLAIDGDGKLGVNFDKVTSREDFNTLVGALVPHPTYDAPTSSLSSTTGTTGEVGTSLSPTLNLSFSQKDGGQAYGAQIKKGGNTVQVGTSFADNIVLGTAAIAYQGVINYYEGPVKKNIIGIDDPVGKIPAGNANSNTINFIGYYATWYGPAAAVPSNRADAIALGGKQLTNASNTFILNTGNSRTIMAIITAPNKSLSSVVDLDALNAVITSEYILQGTIALADAGGGTVNGCKLYIKTMGVPYSTSHRHQITLA